MTVTILESNLKRVTSDPSYVNFNFADTPELNEILVFFVNIAGADGTSCIVTPPGLVNFEGSSPNTNGHSLRAYTKRAGPIETNAYQFQFTGSTSYSVTVFGARVSGLLEKGDYTFDFDANIITSNGTFIEAGVTGLSVEAEGFAIAAVGLSAAFTFNGVDNSFTLMDDDATSMIVASRIYTTASTLQSTLVEWLTAVRAQSIILSFTPQPAEIEDDPLLRAIAMQEQPGLVTWKYHWVDKAGLTIQEDLAGVLGSSIDCENDRATVRIANFSIDPSLMPTLFNLASDHIKIIEMVQVEGVPVEFSRGVYRCNLPKVQEFTNERRIATITAGDLTTHLISTHRVESYTLVAGNTFIGAMEDLLDELLLSHSLPQVAAIALEDLPFAPNTPYIDILAKLAYGINIYTPFPDDDGVFVSAYKFPYFLRTADVTYRDDEEPRMIRGDGSIDYESNNVQNPNAVALILGDPRRPPGFERRFNNDSLSPNSIISRNELDPGEDIDGIYVMPNVGRLNVPGPLSGITGSALGCAWHPDMSGDLWVAMPGGALNMLRLAVFDPATGEFTDDTYLTLPGHIRAVAWNPSGNSLAICHANSPYLTVYRWPELTTISNPATLPTGTCTAVAWAPDNAFISVAMAATPYVHTYPYNNATRAFGTKVTNPSTLPPIAASAVAWEQSTGTSRYLAVGFGDDPGAYIYPFNSAGPSYGDPPLSLPSGDFKGVSGIGWSIPDAPDKKLAVAGYWPFMEPPDPYDQSKVKVYSWDATTGAVIAELNPNPNYPVYHNCNSLQWDPTGALDTFVVGFAGEGTDLWYYPNAAGVINTTFVGYVASREGIALFDAEDTFSKRVTPFGFLAAPNITCIRFSPDGNWLLYSGTHAAAGIVRWQPGAVIPSIIDYELSKHAAAAEQLVLPTVLDPRRQPHELYELTIEGLENSSLWRVLGWQYDCTAGATMTHRLGRSRTLTFTYPEETYRVGG